MPRYKSQSLYLPVVDRRAIGFTFMDGQLRLKIVDKNVDTLFSKEETIRIRRMLTTKRKTRNK